MSDRIATTIKSHFDDEDVHHIISLGAGVQSTVMYLMAALGQLEPTPEAAIFADTRWEPAHVYQHLSWLESLELTIPIVRVSAADLYQNTWDGARVRTGLQYPFTDIPAFTRHEDGSRGMGPRQCTEKYKIDPIRHKMREIIGRRPRISSARPPFVVQWMGISTDEWMRCKDARVGWIANAYPLIEVGMSRADCVSWFNERFPSQPIAKSSCVGCPYHSAREWLTLYRDDPDGMARTIALDERLRDPARVAVEKNGRPKYLHSSLRPLREVLAELDVQDRMQGRLFDEDAQPNGFIGECEGYCST